MAPLGSCWLCQLKVDLFGNSSVIGLDEGIKVNGKKLQFFSVLVLKYSDNVTMVNI